MESRVNSVASQKINNIKLSKNFALQTVVSKAEFASQTANVCDDKITINCNFNNSTPTLTIIKASIAKHKTNFLFETGSSISLLSKHLFDKIKDKLNYK